MCACFVTTLDFGMCVQENGLLCTGVGILRVCVSERMNFCVQACGLKDSYVLENRLLCTGIGGFKGLYGQDSELDCTGMGVSKDRMS